MAMTRRDDIARAIEAFVVDGTRHVPPRFVAEITSESAVRRVPHGELLDGVIEFAAQYVADLPAPGARTCVLLGIDGGELEQIRVSLAHAVSGTASAAEIAATLATLHIVFQTARATGAVIEGA